MKKSTKKAVAGAGLAAAAVAAAAGAYFLYGTKEGKKTRKKIASWALKAKGEVLEKLEQAKTTSEASYKKAVSEVMAKYKKLKREHGPEVEAVARELHSYWNHLKKHLK
ncbi:MAG TPA: hypothetical protein VJH63_04055 [Candidatus Paceibacterota bacterium]